MEVTPELLTALTKAINSLSEALGSNSANTYIVPLITGATGIASGLSVMYLGSNRAAKRELAL